MRHNYITLLPVAMAIAVSFNATAQSPDRLNVEEERWEIHYNLYQSLWSNNPEYLDMSHEVTIKRDAGRIYIRGIFEEYPDAWVTGSYSDTSMHLLRDQNLSQDDESPAYFQRGAAVLTESSANDREYTVSLNMKPRHSEWSFGDDGANQDLIIPKLSNCAIWTSDKLNGGISLSRTYYFDGTSTGDEFLPLPVYVNPSFHKISSSGIMDTVSEQQPEDNRVFDLSGRQVNPDRLTPGIYIRAGHKFIVR